MSCMAMKPKIKFTKFGRMDSGRKHTKEQPTTIALCVYTNHTIKEDNNTPTAHVRAAPLLLV